MEYTFQLYCIKDIVANEAGPIFQAKNDGVAIRNYVAMCMENHLSADEFILYRVGQYDPETMSIRVSDPLQIKGVMNDGKGV
jgi:hypothetical protein